jgi:hypothetical protein
MMFKLVKCPEKYNLNQCCIETSFKISNKINYFSRINYSLCKGI